MEDECVERIRPEVRDGRDKILVGQGGSKGKGKTFGYARLFLDLGFLSMYPSVPVVPAI